MFPCVQLWLVIISVHDIITVLTWLHSLCQDSFSWRFRCALWRLSQNSLPLNVVSELDELHEGRAVSGVGQPQASAQNRVCHSAMLSIGCTSKHCVCCALCKARQTRCDVCTLKNKTAAYWQRWWSNSDIGSTSGQMKGKLESAFGYIPNLLRKNHLTFPKLRFFFPTCVTRNVIYCSTYFLHGFLKL